MKYIIMCGGTYEEWETPKQLLTIGEEPIVARTIRLLRDNGIDDIAISSNNPIFNQFGVPVLKHKNDYGIQNGEECGDWVDGFYPTNEPVCYLFGDVFFSPQAIKKIVETETDDVEFFASAPPYAKKYFKKWAEPFGFKVENQEHFREAILFTKRIRACFDRLPIAWELWQVLKGTQINVIDYTNYTVINDYTTDVDSKEDANKLNKIARRLR